MQDSARNNPNQPVYRNDKSLTHISDDQFKHSHYVEVLTDILEKCETPINIGLYGKWGVGKSSIVHMLKEKIEDCPSSKFKYVEVDSWGLSRESLQQGILEEINSQLGDDAISQQEIEDDLYNIKEVESISYKKTFKHFAIVMGIVTSIVGLISYSIMPENVFEIVSTIGIGSMIMTLIPITKLFLGSAKRIIPKTISTLQFNKIYEKMISTQKNKKLVIVIDNLDRCDNKTAVDLLGIIQTFMVKPNCINILACDDEAIIKHLRNVRGEGYTDRDGNEFLSKFFQLTIRIPPFIGENLEKYASNLMKDRGVDFDSYVRSILISGAIENPRKINQFLNNAVALVHLAKLKENSEKLPKGIITGNIPFLVKMIIIRHEWPYFFKELEKNPHLINDSIKLKKWCQLEYVIPQIEGLEKFLNKTSFAHSDNIIPFLRLNQESYAAESGIDEFSNAVISNDIATVVKLFENLEIDKQNQYVKKLEALANDYAEKVDIPALVICTYSIIAILKNIPDESSRKIPIAYLGHHMSTSLLSELDRYDFSEQNLFQYFEEMESHFSTPIYEKILEAVIVDSKINKKLVYQFFENHKKISQYTMEKLVEKLVKFIETDENTVLDYVVELCTKHKWSKINIPKPSSLLISIINNIQFDSSELDNKRISTYVSIHERISKEEKSKFVEHLTLKIQECTTDSKIMPPQLFELIKNTSIWDDESLLDYIVKLYESLADYLQSKVNNEQEQESMKFLIQFELKLNQLTETVDYRAKLYATLAVYLKTRDFNSLLWFNNLVTDSKANYLISESVLRGYLHNFENNAITNTDILKFILTNTPPSNQHVLIEKFTDLVNTGDASKYQTLLNVLVENPSNYDDKLITAIISSCIAISSALKYPEHISLDEIIINLHDTLDPNQIKSIYERAINLAQDDNLPIQDNGLNLLSLINEKIDSNSNVIGIDESINMAKKFIEQDNKLVRKYLDFIFRFDSHLSWEQEDFIVELIEKMLDEKKPNHINNIALDCVVQNNHVLKRTSEKIIELASNTTVENIKKHCRQVLDILKK